MLPLIEARPLPIFQILVLDPNSRTVREVLRGKFVNVWGSGANVLKPLFVTGCAITAVGFVFSLAFMRMSPLLVGIVNRRIDC